MGCVPLPLKLLLVLLFLRNVNCVPTGTNLPLSANLNENDPISTTATTATATGTGPFTFSFNPASTEFAIGTTTGVVTNLKVFDFETDPTSYTLTVRINDASDTSDTDRVLTVNIVDLNDETPTITGNAPIVLDEEVALGTILTLPYTVDDADAVDTPATLTYAISGGDSALFNLDAGVPGQITVGQRLDYETKSSYTFDLTVTDGNSNAETEVLTINVNDINDNSPACSPSIYYTSIDENTVGAVNVQTLTGCSDSDGTAANNALTYTIVSGDDVAPKFAVSGNSIVTTATATDYETVTQYTLLVDITDPGPQTTKAKVIVQINAVNEAFPVFAATGTPYTILENVNTGHVVDTIVATDADSGTDGTVTYQIVTLVDSGGVNSLGIFEIDSVSGQLTTASLLDRDGGVTHYDITIRASDGNAVSSTTNQVIRVNIADYNDNSPVFTQSSYTINSVTESTAAGTSLELVAASDNDVTAATFTYAITVGDTSKFEFDGTTNGQLNLKAVIDLDNPTNDADYYTLGITVRDGGSPELTGTASVTVRVAAVNQHNPVFGASVPSNTVSLAESDPIGTSVATVVATDADFGTDGDITYSITGGDGGSFFGIDATLGKISTIKALDFDAQPTTSLEITATDGGSTALTVTSVVTITVTDVNINKPTCTDYSVFASIPETSAVNAAVTTVTCTDADASDTLTYSITNGNSASNFDISNAGAITVAAVVNYDSAIQSYNLEVTVTDGTFPVTINVLVTLTPINEDTPSFAVVPDVMVAENTGPGLIATFGATDTDFSPHNIQEYKITAVSQSGLSLFNIDSSDGKIQLVGNLDYDSLPAANKKYEITVKAIDGGPLTGTGTLTIAVTDVNDNSPSCTQSTWTPSIDEALAVNSNVQTLGCTDPDGTTLTYAIVGGDDAAAKFSVSGNSIVTTATPTDFETLTQYSLLVDVVDGGTPKLTITTTVVVQINAVNEASPVFAATGTPYTILESVNTGHVVDTIVATDADTGTDGTVTYQIVTLVDNSGTGALNVFQINSVSGELTTASLLDRDGGVTHYDITIRASDGNAVPKRTDQVIKVNIGDYNDNSPVFTQSSYTINSVTESTAAGTSLALIAASDNDATAATFTYAIAVGDTTKFEFDGTTNGQLNLKAVIDLDSPTNDADYYILGITVRDGGSPELTGTASVTVRVAAVNQHNPVFGASVPSNSVGLAESDPIGTSVATVVATDADFGTDGDITYSITGGDIGSFFGIDATLGKISTIKALDFDAQPTTSLEITATDGGSTALTVTSVVTISVTDVNSNKPTCTDYSIFASLAETAGVGDPVTTVACTDADASDTLTYLITNGNSATNFAISNAGAITVAAVVNYDSAIQSYNLEVTVNDGTFPVNINVLVTLTPNNEATPTFAVVPEVMVAENTGPGQIATYTAADSDFSPHNIQEYKITAVSQSGLSLFTIDSADGKIQLVGNLDYDSLPAANKKYEITVKAIDGGPLTGTGTLTITVTDVNDNTPVCTQSAWTVNINENQATPHTVITPNLGCTDVEDGTTLTYTLVQSPGTLFSVSTAGVLTLDSSLNYEVSIAHTLTITVRDTGTGATTVTVNVNVDDVNEVGPVFTGTFAKTLQEDSGIGTLVLDVVANDPDTNSPFGILEYSIINGDSSNQFLIDSSSGRVTTRAMLDREAAASYNLVVHAKEQVGTNTATVVLAVTITDINDNPPTCTQTTFAETVNEDEAVNFVILGLTCNDVDTTGTITYTISSGDTTTFEMNAANLRLRQTVDFDTGTRKYDQTITVSDGTNTLDIKGSVNVGPINDGGPVFGGAPPYTLVQSESTAISTTITTIAATDVDSADTTDGQIVYSFTTPNPLFSIGASNGQVVLLGNLDREAAPSHVLNIQASDGTSNVATTLTVTVSDENDNPPVFSASSYSGSIAENVAAGAVIATVVATDADDAGTINGQVTFSIDGGSTDFAVGATTGVITNLNALNYETATFHNLVILAVDRNGDASSQSASTVVTITVTNINELAPVYTLTTYNFNLPENSVVSTVVGQVVANDADTGLDGSVYYTMPASTVFYLDGSTGEIRLQVDVDFEGTPNYNFEVTALDRGTSPQRSATATVSIALTNINDVAPSCSPNLVTVTKREDATGVMGSLTCTDGDTLTAAISYAIESVNGAAGAGIFSVGGTGDVSLTGSLNYETATSQSIIILVSDGGSPDLTSTATLNIALIDVNEASPIFGGTPFSATVAETDVSGKSILTVAATDADTADSLTYSLSSTAYFLIDSNSGLITLSNPMTPALSPYTVNVCATDSNTVDATNMGCETITVTVTDVNNNSPVFNPSSYATSVNEDAANGFTFLTVTASDADSGAFGTVTFTITGGNTNNVFAIGPGTGPTFGDISVNDNNFLDFETTKSYSLIITATDGGGLTTTSPVSVSVGAINEAPPVFGSAGSTKSILENAVIGAPVVTLAATDTDDGPDGSVAYSIISGAGGDFGIDGITGVVSVTGILDRETTQTYSVLVHGIDSGANPGFLTGIYALTINIGDVNDLSPSCTSTLYTASLPEDTVAGVIVKQLVCSDLDLDPASLNNDLTYTEVAASDPSNLFEVDAAGLITVSTGASFDRETVVSYQYLVTVSDKGTTPLQLTVGVHIEITDLNDNSPVFSAATYPVTIPEDQVVSSVLTTMVATDADSGAFGDIVFTITAGNGDNKFQLDSSTGALVLISSLDRETTPSYTLTVQASDKEAPARISTAPVTITLTDVNDKPPVCTPGTYTATVQETDPVNTPVITVNCPDASDIAPNNVVVYVILAGDASNHFTINPNTGAIVTNAVLNAQTTPSYSLTITASDGAFTVTAFVQVKVGDINQQAPVFTPAGPYVANLQEDNPLSTTVIDLDATDVDPSAGPFVFSITGGNAEGKFKIDSGTGVIIIQDTLDADTTASYTLNLEVADGTGAGALTSASAITINVAGINDNLPVCNPATDVKAIAEGSAAGTVVTTPACTDADLPTQTLAYTLLSGNGGGQFALDSATGHITLTATALDYETQTDHTLTVSVSDQTVPIGLFTATVKVSVTPVNEHPPVFVGAPYTDSFAEDIIVGTVLRTIVATDADQGLQHGTVRYSLVGGDPGGLFVIGVNTGELKLAKLLDFETSQTHTLNIRATDDVAGSGNERLVDTTVTISVTDKNDNSPQFNPDTYSENVVESSLVSATLLTVTATDDDSGVNKNIVYSITSGDPNNVFNFVNNELILAKLLDFETVTSFTLNVEAADQGVPSLTDTAIITINVLSSNEFPPVLTDTNPSATITELTPVGSILYTATASDNDAGLAGQITYTILSGNPSSVFHIDDQLGHFIVLSKLDFDTAPTVYTVVIEARDTGGLTDTLTLTITLTDENDHTPIFTQNTYLPAVDEELTAGSPVITVQATDSDASAVNNQVSYSIVSGDGVGSFGIDASTGVITTTAVLDHEIKTLYFIVVQAVDNGAPQLTSSCLVKVTVNDINDNLPVFIPGYFTVNVNEDAIVTIAVGTVNANDADSVANSNNVFTYSLTNAFFSVNPTTGELQVKAALDRETIPSHPLTVLATDQGNPIRTGTATVTVNLVDINDNSPVISGTYDTNIAEDLSIGNTVFNIVATDADTGVNSELMYSISNGNINNDFKIDPVSGLCQVQNILDRETTATYMLEITVTDKGAIPRSDVINVIITINDANDNNPVFTGTPYSFTIIENAPVTSPVGTVAATDADVGVNAALTYELLNFWRGNPTHFIVDASIGAVVSAGPLDREQNDVYLVNCRVRDQGAPAKNTLENITITILDQNDNSPVFDSTSYASTTEENKAVGTSILQVTVTDADIGVNGVVTLSIDVSTPEGTTANNFLAVDSATGILSVKSVIDRETNSNFAFKILAIDGGATPLTATATVSLIVSDVNDNNPVFNPVFYNTEVAYAGQCSRSITTVQASDTDQGINAQLNYYLVDPSSFFSVDSTTGTISLLSTASLSPNTKYTLKIGARDNGVASNLISLIVAQVRVDTYIPNNVAVTFTLSINKVDFEAQATQFTAELKALLASKYPSCRVVIWCIEERAGTAISPPARRRLLATNPVNVHTYVVSNNNTDDQTKLNEAKTFLTSDEILAVTTSDAPSGTPSTSISSSSAWNGFAVETVKPYVELTTPWEQTGEGIAIIVVCVLLLVALIMLLIFLCLRRYKRKSRPITPNKAVPTDNKIRAVEKPAPIYVSKQNNVPDLDLNNAKKHPLPAVLALPMPRVDKKKRYEEPFWGAPEDTKIPVPIRTPRVVRTPKTAGSSKPPSRELDPESPEPTRNEAVRTPRNVIITPKELEDNGYMLVNREFDGRAVDPVTGRVYEYNTKTNERRWVSTPDGIDVRVNV